MNASLSQLRQRVRAALSPPIAARGLGDLGIVLAVALTPLILGGRHDLARFVYVASASLAAVGMSSYSALASKQTALPRWPLSLFVGGAVLIVAQCAPLPADWVTAIGPRLPSGSAGDAWANEVGTLSVAPHESAEGLALLGAHALLFIAVWIRVRSAEDVAALCRLMLVVTVGMAFLGVWQYVLGDGMLLGIYRHPHRAFTEFQGTFANKNHFAHFLTLGLGPALWWLACKSKQTSTRRSGLGVQIPWSRLLPVGAVAMLAVAVLATQSRGGVASFCLAGIFGGFLLRRAGVLALRQTTALIAAATVVMVAVSFLGYEQMTARLDDLLSADIDTLDRNHARREIWQANLRAVSASPIVGFGAGTHREFYPAFMAAPFPYEFTHAESGFLQVASEGGIVGIVLVFVAIVVVAAASFRGILAGNDRLLWVAVAPGLAASVLHSTVDFVWYIPGLFAPTLALAAAAIRLSEPNGGDGARVAGGYARVAWVTYVASLAVSLSLGPAHAAGDWDAYLRSSVGVRSMLRYQAIRDANNIDPKLDRTVEQFNDRMIESLEKVVVQDPKNSRAHQRLAARLLQRFEFASLASPSGMPLEMIADAARSGGFRSHADRLAWLDRALGEQAVILKRAHHHAAVASTLCRCHSESALVLAKLNFLDPDPLDPLTLAERAVRLRPHDGGVLFEAGRQYWVAGEPEECLRLWRSAVRIPGGHLNSLTAIASLTMRADVFVDELDPGFDAFRHALRRYRVHGSQEDLVVLCEHATDEAERLERAGDVSPRLLAARWRQASEAMRSIGQYEEAVGASRAALGHAPHDFPVRHELASALRLAGLYAEADAHIRWCLARRPDLGYLRDWLEESAKRRTKVDQNRRERTALYQDLTVPPGGQQTQQHEAVNR